MFLVPVSVGLQYSCAVAAKFETDSLCPCVVFIWRFFRSVLWPPMFAGPTTDLGGAHSVLVQFGCCAGE